MKKQRSNFFELLLKNDQKEIKEYLLSKGKNPKPICPIQFVKDNIIEEEIVKD